VRVRERNAQASVVRLARTSTRFCFDNLGRRCQVGNPVSSKLRVK
jgi:hypothetical protein